MSLLKFFEVKSGKYIYSVMPTFSKIEKLNSTFFKNLVLQRFSQLQELLR